MVVGGADAVVVFVNAVVVIAVVVVLLIEMLFLTWTPSLSTIL